MKGREGERERDGRRRKGESGEGEILITFVNNLCIC